MGHGKTPRIRARHITKGIHKPHNVQKVRSEAMLKALIYAIKITKPAFRVKVWGENWRMVLNTLRESV